MKLSSVAAYAISLVLFCALTFLFAYPIVSSASGPTTGIEPQTDCTTPDPTYTTRAKQVTVYLHGLMVGRMSKEGNDKKARFELGIVKRAPEHKFSFNVYVQGGVCKPINVPKKCRWVFEVQRGGVAVPHNIQRYRPSRPDLEDSRRILNIEDLHSQKLDRFKKAFNRIFYFHNGIVKSKSLTDPLQVGKPDADLESTPTDIGKITEVVGIDILLNPGERLVCRNSDDPSVILWSNEYDPSGEIEGRLTNLPPDHSISVDPCTVPYIRYATTCPENIPHQRERLDAFLSTFQNSATRTRASAMNRVPADDDSPTHFQIYYYLVFRKDRPDRFELINPTPICYDLTDDHDVVIKTVPPYRCGMVLVNGDEIQ